MASEDTGDETPRRIKFRPPLWMGIVIVLLFALAFLGERGIMRTFRMLEYRAELQERIDQLEADNRELRHEIERLRNDYFYLEGLARKNLGMVKEDELVYQFPRTPDSAPANTSDKSSAE